MVPIFVQIKVASRTGPVILASRKFGGTVSLASPAIISSAPIVAFALEPKAPDAVLSRKPRATPAMAKMFDGAGEARLIALGCSHPPEGHARRSRRLLQSKVLELGIVERASDESL